MTPPALREIDTAQIDETSYKACYTGCIVLTSDNKILLQQRGHDWQRYPGFLTTFGGQIEPGETPLQGLVRELDEELGARVNPAETTPLGAITEAISNHTELVYGYFWHDRDNTITGCYEGEPVYYDTTADVLTHPKILEDVKWWLKQCQRLKLLENGAAE